MHIDAVSLEIVGVCICSTALLYQVLCSIETNVCKFTFITVINIWYWSIHFYMFKQQIITLILLNSIIISLVGSFNVCQTYHFIFPLRVTCNGWTYYFNKFYKRKELRSIEVTRLYHFFVIMFSRKTKIPIICPVFFYKHTQFSFTIACSSRFTINDLLELKPQCSSTVINF